MILIVFAAVSDLLGSRFVASMANPGGNIIGFMYIEGKWLELLCQIVPQLGRVGMLYNPETAPYARYFLEAYHSAASTLSTAISRSCSSQRGTLPKWLTASDML